MSGKITVTDNGFLRIDYERDGVRKCTMLDVEKLALLIEPKPKPIDGEEKSFKYILKSRAGINEPDEQELEEWTDDTFRRWENGELTSEEEAEFMTTVHELSSVEWWVEKQPL